MLPTDDERIYVSQARKEKNPFNDTRQRKKEAPHTPTASSLASMLSRFQFKIHLQSALSPSVHPCFYLCYPFPHTPAWPRHYIIPQSVYPPFNLLGTLYSVCCMLSVKYAAISGGATTLGSIVSELFNWWTTQRGVGPTKDGKVQDAPSEWGIEGK